MSPFPVRWFAIVFKTLQCHMTRYHKSDVTPFVEPIPEITSEQTIDELPEEPSDSSQTNKTLKEDFFEFQISQEPIQFKR